MKLKSLFKRKSVAPSLQEPTQQLVKLPAVVIWVTIAISVLPFLISLIAGYDFGNHSLTLSAEQLSKMQSNEITESMFLAMSGALTHALLEWTAFCIALITVVLAFVHYRLAKDIAIPIICVALFFSGVMDAFHTLAAGRLISANADNANLIPFTWAIARLFNAIIMIIGVGLFMTKGLRDRKMPIGILFVIIITMGAVAYGLITYMATSTMLPQTQFPDAFITRPYDVIPLLLYLFALLFIYPRFYKLKPSPFAHALILTALIEVFVECHMAFGSFMLFDNHFNIAHFLKIIGYAVPLIGLLLDYIQTYQQQQQNQFMLQKQAIDLMKTNRELDEFAYIASHDLKEPLRGINNYTTFLKEDYGDKFDKEGHDMLNSLIRLTHRLQSLIDNLLDFSRVSRADVTYKTCDMDIVVREAIDLVQSRLSEENVGIRIPEKLPSIVCDTSRVQDIFLNLITNAMKYNDRDEKWIEIGINRKPIPLPKVVAAGSTIFYVKDNGIGIATKHYDNIFRIFKRLHGQGKYGGGTGAGLTIVKKIIEHQGGSIWVNSIDGKGTTSYFSFGNHKNNQKDD